MQTLSGNVPSDVAVPVVAELRERCNHHYPGVLQKFPPEQFIRLYEENSAAPYWSVSSEMRSFLASIEHEYSQEAATLVQQISVALSIAHVDKADRSLVLPDSLWPNIDQERLRILEDIRAGWRDREPGFSDYFLKDWAIARLHAIPSGPHMVELWSGVPRRIVLTGGIRQALEVLSTFYLRQRPFRPMMAIHLSEKALSEFTPAGRERCFLQLADVLAANPELAGVFGASWYYDPALERISPHLAFLREPERHGAKLFRLRTNEQTTNLALGKSRTRRRLFEAGEYQPTAFMMVWLRDDLLRWAASMSARQTTAEACRRPAETGH